MMEKKSVPELKVANWMCEGENVIVDLKTEKLLLNKSAKIVWELIDGINSVEEITNEIIMKYGDQNEEAYLIEIVNETLSMLEKDNLIVIRETNDFDGWLEYE